MVSGNIDDIVSDFPVDLGLINPIKRRVKIAAELEKIQMHQRKVLPPSSLPLSLPLVGSGQQRLADQDCHGG